MKTNSIGQSSKSFCQSEEWKVIRPDYVFTWTDTRINFQTQIYQLQPRLLTTTRDQNRRACTNLLEASQELQTLKT
jgi:hypothetical protein